MVRIIRHKGKLATAEMNRPAVHEERKQDLEGTNPMKTKEELNALKKEVESLNKKLAELTDEELAQVTGGILSTQLSTSVIFEVDGADLRR